MIDKAVKAKGGVDKLRSIRTVRAVSDMLFDTPRGTVTVPTTLRVQYPWQFRVDSDMPAGPVSQVFDSGTFWVRDQRGVTLLTDEAAEPMRQNVVRDQIGLLLALNDGRLSARRAADVLVEGHAMPVLQVNLRTSGRLVLVLDAASGLIIRQRYPARVGNADVEESLSDYRDVKGLQVAFSVTIRHPGEPTITRTLRTFEYNVPLDASVFARPS